MRKISYAIAVTKGTERLSEPFELVASASVAANPVKAAQTISISNGRKKAAPKAQAKKSVPTYIIMVAERNIAALPWKDFSSSHKRNLRGCFSCSPTIEANVSDKAITTMESISVIGFSQKKADKTKNASGKYTVPKVVRSVACMLLKAFDFKVSAFTTIKIDARVMGCKLEVKISGQSVTISPTITWTILRLASGPHFNRERRNSAMPIKIKMATKNAPNVIHSFSKGVKRGKSMVNPDGIY